MGFGAKTKSTANTKVGDVLRHVETEDLLKFGLIPEFIGRFSVIGTLDGLDEKDLVRVLTEPRNSLVKQYQKFFKMENVSLKFEPDALEEIAREAIRKKTGARALRSILEDMMLDIMYDLPSQDDVVECIIKREAVTKQEPPHLIRVSSQDRAKTA